MGKPADTAKAHSVFATEDWTPFPLEQVFGFFSQPENLPRLMPPSARVRLEQLRLRPAAEDPRGLAAGVGSEVLIRFAPLPGLPLRARWTARIVEFAWLSHFVDEQVEGPFVRFRHRHGFARQRRQGVAGTVDGTVVSDRVEFVLPAGWLGQLALPLLRRELGRQFAARQRRLPELLKAATR